MGDVGGAAGMLRFGSGTYNVRESECQRSDAGAVRALTATVHFLDGTQEDFELDVTLPSAFCLPLTHSAPLLQRHARGQELLDRVMEHLDLVEKDYFGLRFLDAPPKEPDNRVLSLPLFSRSVHTHTYVQRWLEPGKSIRRQMAFPPFLLRFQVKFYVSDPSKLHEEYTRFPPGPISSTGTRDTNNCMQIPPLPPAETGPSRGSPLVLRILCGASGYGAEWGRGGTGLEVGGLQARTRCSRSWGTGAWKSTGTTTSATSSSSPTKPFSYPAKSPNCTSSIGIEPTPVVNLFTRSKPMCEHSFGVYTRSLQPIAPPSTWE